jgi:hypothetical protein
VEDSRTDKEFRGELAARGFRVVAMEPDGNCLFRSLAHQLEPYASGDGAEGHLQLRWELVAFMRSPKQQEHFALFVEDDENFDDYCDKMLQDGEWGGNQEIVAASWLFGTHISILQHNQPVWHVECPPERQQRQQHHRESIKVKVHLSFHGNDHYNALESIQGSKAALVQPPPSPPLRPASKPGEGKVKDKAPPTPAMASVDASLSKLRIIGSSDSEHNPKASLSAMGVEPTKPGTSQQCEGKTMMTTATVTATVTRLEDLKTDSRSEAVVAVGDRAGDGPEREAGRTGRTHKPFAPALALEPASLSLSPSVPATATATATATGKGLQAKRQKRAAIAAATATACLSKRELRRLLKGSAGKTPEEWQQQQQQQQEQQQQQSQPEQQLSLCGAIGI